MAFVNGRQTRKTRKKKNRHGQKILPDQQAELFQEFIALPRSEQVHFCTNKSAELGVDRKTIQRIVYDDDRMKRFLAGKDRIKDLELARAYANLGKALDVQIGIINQADKLPPNMLGIAQNAATDLMNRLNFKEKVAEEDRTMRVVFGSDIPLGMPKPVEDGKELLPDGASNASESDEVV